MAAAPRHHHGLFEIQAEHLSGFRESRKLQPASRDVVYGLFGSADHGRHGDEAASEPAFRFCTLYDKICRADILAHAYEVACANAGAPGVDGMTSEHIEASGLEEWLANLPKPLPSGLAPSLLSSTLYCRTYSRGE